MSIREQNASQRLAVYRMDRRGLDTLLLALSGDWVLTRPMPDMAALISRMDSTDGVRRLAFESGQIGHWDSRLLTFLLNVRRLCVERQIAFLADGLPSGVGRLLALATAVPERKGARGEEKTEPLLVRTGEAAETYARAAIDLLGFIGDVFLSFVRLCAGRSRFPFRDFWALLQDCGARALPIVSLISVLVGVILAFVGAVQLQMFGAQIYVANLVGLGMAREMGAMMAAVIMAGRTGAAFAAQLGTMQVNEEIDALVTMGLSPVDFLVLPRIAALVLMMPLLCVYADLMGIAGGFIVAIAMLDLPFTQYLTQTVNAVPLHHFVVGIVKSGVFGVIVAMSGCLRGMQCGRSATAVGAATTRAVVTGIVCIIIADAVITVICDVIGV